MPYAFALQSLPKVAIAPLIVIWCGFGDGSKVAMAALLAFFPMLVNSFAGMRSADIERIELMKALSASRLETYRLVKLPSAAPYIFAGLDMGIVYALLGTIVAEFLGAQEGMGVVITKAQAVTDVAGVFAVLTILGVTGIALASHRALDPALTDPLGRSRTTLGRENNDQSPQGGSRNWRNRARSCNAVRGPRAGAAQDPHGLRHQVGQSDRDQHPDLGATRLHARKKACSSRRPRSAPTPTCRSRSTRATSSLASARRAFQFPLFAKGQLPPIVNYYEYTYPYKWDVAVKPEAGIQKYEDLKGKKIGVSDMGTTDYPVTRAVLQNLGIDPDKDVSWVAVGAGVSAGVALQRGVIDALAYFDTGFGQIDAAGIAMRMLPRPANVPLIGGLFISATANFLKDNRKIAIGFARAVNKASEFLLANPEAGARAFLKLYPETAPRGASEAEAVKSILFAANRRIPLYRPPYPNTKMGFIRESELLLDAKFLGLDIKDIKPMFTNDMIDEINNYDRDKIIAQAKAYKS